MHWSMRTHLANTALQVDDWILRGRTFERSNVETFECSNIQWEEHLGKEEFGFSAVPILCVQNLDLIQIDSILDLSTDLDLKNFQQVKI